MLHDVRDGFVHAVEVGHLVEDAVHRAFGAGAVVADLVEDQRIVQLTGLGQSIDQPADLVVGLFAESGEDFHLMGEELLFVRG